MSDGTLSREFLGRLLPGAELAAEGPEAVRRLRRDALERANALAVPSVRDEDWRFTDLTPLYRAALRPGQAMPDVPAARLDAFSAEEAAARLVFVDGRFAPELSSVSSAGDLEVRDLGAAIADGAAALATGFGELADWRSDVFTAVNTAWLRGGAFVRAGPRCSGGVVHCLFVSASADVVCHPRVFVQAAPGSAVTVVEEYVALHEAGGCTNAVTEIAIGANAAVRHVRAQRDSLEAFHIGTTAVRAERDARYEAQSLALGARLSRYTLHVAQRAPGTHFAIDGLAWIGGRQLADTHSFVDHGAPHGTSRQVHKCVVDGAAHAVFNGRILVREGAQQTDSSQESRTLLLSARAHVDAKPQLEIFADDVKCAHGATVGQLEDDEVFYLRSRGLSEALARQVLTFGFAAEVVARVPVPSLAQRLRGWLLERSGSKEIA